MFERAGQPAQPGDLIDVDRLLDAYYDVVPDADNPAQRVVFGTSGHRGSSLRGTFNEAHILSITTAIVEYRRKEGIDGPLFMGVDPHALSEPAWRTALEVLSAAGVETYVDARRSWTPTPAISLAILRANSGVSAKEATRAARTTNRPDDLTAIRQRGLADGIIVTSSHNPPADGGIKYNPPTGGPADAATTTWIAERANQILQDEWRKLPRRSIGDVTSAPHVHFYDFLEDYVRQLEQVIDFDPIRESGLRIGADPMGGASVDYWAAIAERYGLDLTVVNSQVDPTWEFMTLDWDEQIRMDCSSPYAMASLVKHMQSGAQGRTSSPLPQISFERIAQYSAAASARARALAASLRQAGGAGIDSEFPQLPLTFDLATGNDADADRHGIITTAGLMNPNHFLAVAIEYLFQHRPQWSGAAKVGKTLVSSALIDRVAAALGREVMEVPVGFKYFVPGLLSGELGFGGEESAGASCLRRDGSVWTTDKDGIAMCLLAAEIMAVTGRSPSDLYAEQVERFGHSWYARFDQPATVELKERLARLTPEDVQAETLAGEPIMSKLTRAPGDGSPIGGLKVVTQNAWFAARPSGTEDVYKIYAESFLGEDHLREVQQEALGVISLLM